MILFILSGVRVFKPVAGLCLVRHIYASCMCCCANHTLPTLPPVHTRESSDLFTSHHVLLSEVLGRTVRNRPDN